MAANRLPTPQEGIWSVAPRMYLPHPEVVDTRWQCPLVSRVG
ncbi:hypothetical protein [Streptomyces sp. 142MFCol3.1]|nr:hypothetical protein [Streptomyces sp. 142MFCol3.1]